MASKGRGKYRCLALQRSVAHTLLQITTKVELEAGKGRSGTLACALLLYLEERLMPPKLQRSYNPSEWANKRADEAMQHVVIENDDGGIADVGKESDAPSITEQKGAANGEINYKLDGPNSTPCSRSPSPSPDVSNHEKRKSTAAETLGDILTLHTARRMKKTTSHRGVNIASQRRWLRYWSEIVYQVHPPQVWATPSVQHPKAKIHSINIRMRTTGGGATLAVVRMANVLLESATKRRGATSDRGASTIWVSLARYEDEFVEELEKRVRNKEETESMFVDGKYDDKKMVRSFARMGVAEGHTLAVEDVPGVGPVVNYRLHPIPASEWVTVDGADEQDDFMMSSAVDSESGITVDPAREVRIKLYNAQVGPLVLPANDVADNAVQVFMGWLWFIPCFHLPQPSMPTAPVKFVLSRSEVDFPLGFGALLLDAEVTLGWTMDESVPSLVPETEATRAEPSSMGIIAIGGVPGAIRGARD
jgi:phosphatidylinositol-3,4,5-trisphosphate 3-phosphatase and dual-specificity protein phosphatase PTEN